MTKTLRLPRSAEVEKLLTLTTEHLRPSDYNCLSIWLVRDMEDPSVPVYRTDFPGGYATPMPCGWLIRLYVEEGSPQVGDMVGAGYSPEFAALLLYCLQRDVRYIRLDRDAEALPGLPVFEQ